MALRALMDEDHRITLHEALAFAQARVNSTIDPALGVSPHEAVYGFPLQSPLAQWASSQTSSTPDDDEDLEKFIAHPNKKHKRAIRSACDKLRRRREKIVQDWRELWQERKPQPINKPDGFKLGEKVLVWTQPSHKLDRMWQEGEIIRRIGTRCYEVKLSNNSKQLYSADHLKTYLPPNKVYSDDDTPPIDDDDDDSSVTPMLPTRSSRHTKFIMWKDPHDDKVRYGKIERWTGTGEYLIQEYRLGSNDKLSAVDSVGSFLKLSPKDVKKIKVDEATNTLLGEKLDEVAP
ncbi:hypothetical protein FOZ61_001148 [Perkinsus olseni]|uniref:Uncharacterized protein n=1 Tax=Perkinsus olseni TaxID=32597 RepID=A0A7J6KSN5_PEROL|nr:hypothetical protein FOZ61_001148 [Perkinsus olseni]